MAYNDDLTYDNRQTCVNTLPSSCIPYVGYVSNTIKDTLACKPNINDILKKLQELIDAINIGLGDNKTLDKKCLTFNALTIKQNELNQEFITQICELKTALALLGTPINPNLINVAINLLCLQTEGCDVTPTYTLQEILEKLIQKYCDLLDRVKIIENFLNL